MEFRLLGSFEVADDERLVDLPRGRARSLLALLALHPGEVLSSDRLIDELWGTAAPPTATTALQGLVLSLRKRLEPERRGGQAPTLLRTHAPGYLLDIDRAQVDANRFRGLVEHAAGAPVSRRAAELRTALALWRGPALSEFVYEPFAQAAITALEELRLTAIEHRIDAELALGHHAQVVAELEELAAHHPFRERVSAQLMVALYRSGRQAEALEVFRNTRRLLVDELGIEPGTELVELEHAILRQEPAPDLVERPAPPAQQRPWLPMARKVTTIVFVDLARSGGAQPECDPETLRAQLTRFLPQASEIFSRHGGSVKGFIGDVLVAVFGIPTAHEDDAVRAVRAAVEVRRTLADQNHAETGQRLVARIGINTGDVVVGDPVTDETTATGDAVKVAARLQQVARPGEVLLGEATRRLIGDAAVVQAAEVPAPEGAGAAWILLDLSPRTAARSPDLDTPLAGRTAELAQLHRAFSTAIRDQRATLVTVVGEAGIGKSRLALEFARSAGDEVTVLTGHCPAYGEGIMFWPLRELVLQATPDGSPAALADLLAGTDDAISTAEQIAGAIGVAEGTAHPQRLFPAVRTLLTVLARTHPLVIVVDDAHWAQPTFLDLVDYLAGSIRAAVLLMCLARPEPRDEHPLWQRNRPRTETLVLEALAPDESERLVTNRLTDQLLPARTRARVLEIAQGNPLFLEQMLAALADDPDLAIPPSVLALLAARLDRLGPAEQDLLRCASVAGVHFPANALTAIVPDAARPFVDDHLAALCAKDFIRPRGEAFLGERAFTFRHVLIQDAAYRSTTRQDRAELHERFAGWLEETRGQRSPELDELAGYHLEQALEQRRLLGLADNHTERLAARAGEHLANAGLRAYSRLDAAGAANLLSRAGALLPREHPLRWQAIQPLPEMYQVLGRHRDADQVLTEMLDADRTDGDQHRQQRIRVEQARIRLITGPDPTPLDSILADTQRAAEMFAACGDDAGVAQAAYVTGLIHLRRGDPRAMAEVAKQGLVRAQRCGHAREEVAMRWWVALALVEGPTPVRDCIPACEELVAWQGQEHPGVLTELARLHAMRGNTERGRALVGRARDLFMERIRGRRPLMFTALRRAEVELLAGTRPNVAEEQLKPALDLAIDMGERDPAAQIAALLSRVLLERGRSGDARSFAAVSRNQAPAESVAAQGLWRAVTARALADHDVVEAAHLAREADRYPPAELPNLRGDVLLDLADVLRTAGRNDRARATIDEAVAHYQRKGNVAGMRRARARPWTRIP